MTELPYRLNPLKNTQSIPINWKFSQDDYDKITKGHRSNWCVFLSSDVVHFCRISGDEFYRFAVSKNNQGIYVGNNLETYVTDDFSLSAKIKGWTKEEFKEHENNFRKLVLEETSGLLDSCFGIRVGEN